MPNFCIFEQWKCAKQTFLHASGHDCRRSAGTASWSLYLPPGLTFTNSTFCPHSVFVCFVWISEQTAIISCCTPSMQKSKTHMSAWVSRWTSLEGRQCCPYWLSCEVEPNAITAVIPTRFIVVSPNFRTRRISIKQSSQSEESKTLNIIQLHLT
jgi:hypothetical protein